LSPRSRNRRIQTLLDHQTLSPVSPCLALSTSSAEGNETGLPSLSPNLPGRRSKRYAIRQLTRPHTQKHTHPSEPIAISHCKRPQTYSYFIVWRLDSDSCNFKVNLGHGREATSELAERPRMGSNARERRFIAKASSAPIKEVIVGPLLPTFPTKLDRDLPAASNAAQAQPSTGLHFHIAYTWPPTGVAVGIRPTEERHVKQIQRNVHGWANGTYRPKG
jgi:hypothetical protein